MDDFDVSPQAWMLQGACRRYDWHLWFPERGSAQGDITLAKQICDEECPVRAECLAYAIDTRQEFGIWGGTGVRERRRLRRVGAPPQTRRHGTQSSYAMGCDCSLCREANNAYKRTHRNRDRSALEGVADDTWMPRITSMSSPDRRQAL